MGLFDFLNGKKEELQPEQPFKIENPAVQEYMAKYSDANRENIVDEDRGPNLLAAVAALGSGLQGGNAAETGMNFRRNQKAMHDKKLSDFDSGKSLAEENDPMSAQSKLAQQAAIELGVKPEIVNGMTADQFKKQGPMFEKIYQVKQARLSRQDAASERDFARQSSAHEKSLVRDEKKNEKQLASDEKKKATTNEIEQRRTNIKDNLALLQSQIDENGTWEAFGSHNQDMERRLDQIATDMSKLMDPNSVARPGEVELVKQGLIKAGFKNSNATAKKLLQNFEKEVDDRAANAYSIRGIDNPGYAKAAPPAMNSDDAAKTRQERIAALQTKRAGGVASK